MTPEEIKNLDEFSEGISNFDAESEAPELSLRTSRDLVFLNSIMPRDTFVAEVIHKTIHFISLSKVLSLEGAFPSVVMFEEMMNQLTAKMEEDAGEIIEKTKKGGF